MFDDGVLLQQRIVCVVEAEGPHERILCFPFRLTRPDA